MNKKKILMLTEIILLALLFAVMSGSCNSVSGISGSESTISEAESTEDATEALSEKNVGDSEEAQETESILMTEQETGESPESCDESETASETETSAAETTAPETTAPVITADGTGIYYDNGGYLVSIDPGHQAKGNSDQEPVGPGASETKARVSSGTQGVVTGIAEHELNLAVSLYLRDELLARGYSVLMIRETADVDISNAKRAELANSYSADIFVRIHGNSVSDQDVKGALTMCMTRDNPYNGNLYNPSRVLSEKVLEGLCAATGAVNKGIMETDTMSGINWCSVPVTIVEMGFMSNPDEDKAMAEDSYRQKLAEGIADGIDAYFGRH